MKKYGIILSTLVLTATLLVGCGCTNQDKNATVPTVLPTNEEVYPTTRETSRPTTIPTTETPSTPEDSNSSQPSIDHGNGPLEETATETTGTGTTAGDSTRGIMNGNGSAGRGTAAG